MTQAAGAAAPASQACLACGSAAPQVLLYRKHGCDIFRCPACGIGRTETRSFDPLAYYNADYFSGKHSDGYADYVGAESVLRREFAHTVDFVRRFVPKGRLLELGCAYGFFLQEARRHFEVGGIELAEEAAEHCRKSGLNVATGIADEATLAGFGNVDVIVLLDVIEHLPDPRETLALCLKRLNPGGILVLSTGDFGSLSARLAGSGWRLMTPPQHLWFFSEQSIRRLGTSLGLTVEHFDHPWKFVPLSLIAFQLRRILNLRTAAEPSTSRLGLPVNLFDAMRVVLRKR